MSITLTFPQSASVGQSFQTGSSATYIWNGTHWNTPVGQTTNVDLVEQAFTSSYATTASLSFTASYIASASNAVSSSTALTSSYNLTSSYVSTSSYSLSSSFTVSSSYAATASYQIKADTQNTLVDLTGNNEWTTVIDGLFQVAYSTATYLWYFRNVSGQTLDYSIQSSKYIPSGTSHTTVLDTSPITGTSSNTTVVPMTATSFGANYDGAVMESIVTLTLSNNIRRYYVRCTNDGNVTRYFTSIERIN